MNTARRQSAIIITGMALLCSVYLLQVKLLEFRSPLLPLAELRYLPDGKYLKAVSLGYEQLVADILWVQAIQVMGERKVSEEAGRWVYRALDAITTLDPHFVRAYDAGATALTTVVVLPEESNRLLEKGIRHNPEEWRLPFLLGFNYYFEFQDDARAAEYMARASRLPGAPRTLAQLAARLYAAAHEPQLAIDLLMNVYERTADDSVRMSLEQRIKEVVVERDLQMLERFIKLYHDREHRFPRRLDDLIGPGYLRELPREPFGGSYLYDSATGTVRSSEMSERLTRLGTRRQK